jgi:hypothetical protein
MVSEGYLRAVPLDPMAGSNQTWHTIMEDTSQSVSQTEPGIFDVRSGSDKTGLDGTSYSECEHGRPRSPAGFRPSPGRLLNSVLRSY